MICDHEAKEHCGEAIGQKENGEKEKVRIEMEAQNNS